MLDEKYSGSLNDVLNRLIAEQDRINPNEVTVEYIRRQRENRLIDNPFENINWEWFGYAS